jgi:hypothetical protein
MMNVVGVSVDRLWTRLQEMEAERRFSGEAYPTGMCSFPFKLRGQGFFPGGDGLWRDDAALDQESSGVLPVGGIVFVANDFGTRATYLKLESKGFENPPTWRHLKERIRRANLPKHKAFFTNAIVGLRSERDSKALDVSNWGGEPAFASFCREFLVYQIGALRPRLVVVLGPVARASVESLGAIRKTAGLPAATFGCHATAIHFASHPYGDLGFTDSRRADEALTLRNAWDRSAHLGL